MTSVDPSAEEATIWLVLLYFWPVPFILGHYFTSKRVINIYGYPAKVFCIVTINWIIFFTVFGGGD